MNSFLSEIIKCRDFEAGEEAVKAKDTAYLPMLALSSLYPAYKQRALVFEVIPRTINCMKGLVYRKDPEVNLTPRLEYMQFSADNYGQGLYTFVKEVLHQTINPGRVGVLVDIDASGKPYFVKYIAEDIDDYELSMVGGKQKVTAIKLVERIKKSNVLFDKDRELQYRVLRIVNGVYVQQVFNTAGDMVSETMPIVRGKPLDFIPFVFINGDGSLNAIETRPPLMPIVNTNCSHYVASADLEYSRHYNACPQLCLVGFPVPEDGKRRLGPSVVLETNEPNAKAFYISAPPIEPLERAVAEKEKQMSVLGANLFMDSMANTATEAILRNSSANSVLTNIVVAVSDGMTVALNYADIMYGGTGGECRYELNTSFYNVTLNPAEIVAITALYQAGDISQDTFLKRLGALEILPQGKTVEQEKADIAKDPKPETAQVVTQS